MTMDPFPAGAAVPHLRTPVPGPESLRLFKAEQALRAAGTSSGSQWARLAVVDGKGALIRDADGNILLDACSGTVVMNIGHGSDAVARALADQARQITHFYDFTAPVRVDFLRELRNTLPSRFDAFHLVNSGAEAVECALRVARSATGRHEIMAFHHGYHGRTYGALSLTTGGNRLKLGPLLPGVVHAPSAYCYRCPIGSTPDRCATQCADLFERAAEQTLSDAPAAVFIEPVQGAGGTIPMPAEFLRRLREFCDRTGALLVFDEILTGAGRTGRMWAFEHSGVVPDLLLSGKGLAGGYPLGLVAGPRDVMDAAPAGLPTHNSSTFGGGQLGCAAGLACLRTLREEGLVENSARVGGYLLDRLRTTLADAPCVGDIRGVGLLIGVELVGDRSSRRPPDPDLPQRVLRGMLARGVVISSGGAVVRLTPPLCLTTEQADIIVEALADTLREIDRQAVPAAQ